MSVQTSYSQDPVIGIDGCPADNGPSDINSFIVEQSGGMKAGRVGVRGTARGQISLPPTPSATDADGIKTAFGTTAGIQTFTTFNGVLGAARSPYGYRITLTQDTHADWNATSVTVKGYSAKTGEIVTETLTTIDGGNATLTTKTWFALPLLEVVIPAQAGTGGSGQLGVLGGSAEVVFNRALLEGFLVNRTSRESATFANEEAVGVARKGRFYVKVEATCSEGQRAYVRITAAGAEEVGRFRADTDGGDAIPFPGIFRRDTTGADAINVLEVDLDGFAGEPQAL